jgi:hypothetical protein
MIDRRHFDIIKIGLIGTVATLALSGCGIAAKVDARNNMRASLAEYKACLAQNSQNLKACEASRLAYNADMRAYRATSAGIQPGRNDTINVNTDGD